MNQTKNKYTSWVKQNLCEMIIFWTCFCLGQPNILDWMCLQPTQYIRHSQRFMNLYNCIVCPLTKIGNSDSTRLYHIRQRKDGSKSNGQGKQSHPLLIFEKKKRKSNLIYTISTTEFQIIQKSSQICKSHNLCLAMAIKKTTKNHNAKRRWKKSDLIQIWGFYVNPPKSTSLFCETQTEERPKSIPLMATSQRGQQKENDPNSYTFFFFFNKTCI